MQRVWQSEDLSDELRFTSLSWQIGTWIDVKQPQREKNIPQRGQWGNQRSLEEDSHIQ